MAIGHFAGCSSPRYGPPAGRVYAINPMAVARYRERHTVGLGKSDYADAMMLANMLRTDAHAHRTPRDSPWTHAIAVLARAQQDAIWRRTNAAYGLRSLLREYFLVFLDRLAANAATTPHMPRSTSDSRAGADCGGEAAEDQPSAALGWAGRKRHVEATT